MFWSSECFQSLRGMWAQEGKEWWSRVKSLSKKRVFRRKECTERRRFCREKLSCFLFHSCLSRSESIHQIQISSRLTVISLNFLKMGKTNSNKLVLLTVILLLVISVYPKSSVGWCSRNCYPRIQSCTHLVSWVCRLRIQRCDTSKSGLGSSRLSLRLSFVVDVNDKSLTGALRPIKFHLLSPPNYWPFHLRLPFTPLLGLINNNVESREIHL